MANYLTTCNKTIMCRACVMRGKFDCQRCEKRQAEVEEVSGDATGGRDFTKPRCWSQS